MASWRGWSCWEPGPLVPMFLRSGGHPTGRRRGRESRRKELCEHGVLVPVQLRKEPHVPTRVSHPAWARGGALAAFLWGCL